MIEVQTPSRLHFGLLAHQRDAPRKFGGVGMMIQHPATILRARLAERYAASGPDHDRALTFARTFIEAAREAGLGQPIEAAKLNVIQVPRAHTGLGSGTQLAMAVGHALSQLAGTGPLDASTLATLVARGLRSAVGAHGFFQGGLIVDGGKTQTDALAPALVRHPVPEHWRIVLVSPARLQGINGPAERKAFANLPDISDAQTARMCQLVLLGLLPALVEDDVQSFGQALYELQQLAGECFKQVQGGIYADPALAEVVGFIRRSGFSGVGQSSWGPTLYAITDEDELAERLARAIRDRFGLDERQVWVTEPDNTGVRHRMIRQPAPAGLD